MANTDTIHNEIHRLLKADLAFSTIEVETKTVGQYMRTTEYLVTPTPEGAATYGVRPDGLLYITFFVDDEVAKECGVSVGEVASASDDAIIEGSITTNRKVFERKSRVKARNDLAKAMYNIVSAHAQEDLDTNVEPEVRVAASSADAVATAIVNAVASSKLGQGIIRRSVGSTYIEWTVGAGFGSSRGTYGVMATVRGDESGYTVTFSRDIPLSMVVPGANEAAASAAVKMVQHLVKQVSNIQNIAERVVDDYNDMD